MNLWARDWLFIVHCIAVEAMCYSVRNKAVEKVASMFFLGNKDTVALKLCHAPHLIIFKFGARMDPWEAAKNRVGKAMNNKGE